MKNTYTVNFVRNDQVCDPIEEHTASNKLVAIKSARKEAKSWRGHVDFKGDRSKSGCKLRMKAI